MTAIGEQLRAAREERGLSLDQISDETNIAKRYLAAMENEDFSVFPGDPYIVGFLRNYAEYLGLDGAAMVQTFRGIRIQEQPIPLKELLPERRRRAWPFVAVGVALAVAAALAVAFLVPRGGDGSEPAAARPDPAQYVFEGAEFENRLYVGDTVMVAYAGETHRVSVAAIDDRVTLETPLGRIRVMMGEESPLDLDDDNQPELTVFIADFQKNDPDRGAVVRLSPAGSLAVAAAPEAPVVIAAPEAATAAVQPAAAAPDRPATHEMVLFSGKRSPYPFVVNVIFRNYAMFRHEIDRKDREERYYHKGDQITVSANNAAKIWTSNAAACKLTIQASGGQSADVELGLPGEVAVKQIKWVQADDGTWNLSVFDVD